MSSGVSSGACVERLGCMNPVRLEEGEKVENSPPSRLRARGVVLTVALVVLLVGISVSKSFLTRWSIYATSSVSQGADRVKFIPTTLHTTSLTPAHTEHA